MYYKVNPTRYIMFIILLLGAFNLFANSKPLDAKIQKIKHQKDDTNKVIALNKAVIETIETDLNQSIQLSYQALDLAKKLNYQRGIGKAYISIAITFDVSRKTIEAHSYLNKALAIFNKLNDKENQALCYREIGGVYYTEGKYKDGIKALNTSLKISSKDKLAVAETYNSIGISNGIVGNLPEALKYFLKSLKIREDLKDYSKIGQSYVNIGIVYTKQNELELAKKYYFKLLAVSKKTNDKYLLTHSYSCLGNLYSSLGDDDKALTYHNLSLTIKLQLSDKSRIAESFNDLGDVYFKRKNYKDAEFNYKKALSIYIEDNNKTDKPYPLNNLAKLYTKIKKYDLAEKYFTESQDILQMLNTKEGLLLNYFGQYELFEKKGDYHKALKYHKLYIVYRDSLENEENTMKIIQSEMQYEFDKKSVADSIRNLEKHKVKDAEIALANAEIKRDKSQLLLVITGLIIVILALGIVYNRFKISQKQRATIEKQKAQIVESINYSKKIQDALLPDIKGMKEFIRNIFVFFHPKDIVSGDFYWYKNINNNTILACVDCTGHGVPGAFMSTIGNLVLDKITNPESLTPSVILSDLNNEIIRLLRQQSGGELQDGMDLSVCIIDHEKKQISYSGARNGIIIISNGEAQRYKADLLPVGGNYIKKGKPIIREFTTQTIDISENDWIFMYTDGFIEQIGGENNLPMNFQHYEKILVSICEINTDEGKIATLNAELNKWRGENESTDDILIIGFQV